MPTTAGHLTSTVMTQDRLGLLAFRQGDLQHAIPVLEHALAQCRAADIPLYLPAIMATLGLAYARSGQVTEALHLLDQVEVRQTTGGGGDRVMLHLGEGYLLAGRVEDAHRLAERVLALSRDRKERGNQAWALLAAWRDRRCTRHPPDAALAETHYRQALALAEELGMRPLQAHCHAWSRHPVYHDRPLGAGPHRAIRGHRTVPCHGDDVLAAADGGHAGASVRDVPEVAPPTEGPIRHLKVPGKFTGHRGSGTSRRTVRGPQYRRAARVGLLRSVGHRVRKERCHSDVMRHLCKGDGTGGASRRLRRSPQCVSSLEACLNAAVTDSGVDTLVNQSILVKIRVKAGKNFNAQQAATKSYQSIMKVKRT